MGRSGRQRKLLAIFGDHVAIEYDRMKAGSSRQPLSGDARPDTKHILSRPGEQL